MILGVAHGVLRKHIACKLTYDIYPSSCNRKPCFLCLPTSRWAHSWWSLRYPRSRCLRAQSPSCVCRLNRPPAICDQGDITNQLATACTSSLHEVHMESNSRRNFGKATYRVRTKITQLDEIIQRKVWWLIIILIQRLARDFNQQCWNSKANMNQTMGSQVGEIWLEKWNTGWKLWRTMWLQENKVTIQTINDNKYSFSNEYSMKFKSPPFDENLKRQCPLWGVKLNPRRAWISQYYKVQHQVPVD